MQGIISQYLILHGKNSHFSVLIPCYHFIYLLISCTYIKSWLPERTECQNTRENEVPHTHEFFFAS